MEDIVVLVVTLQKYSFVLFLAALICGWMGTSKINKGDMRAGRVLLKIAFVACVVLSATSGLSLLIVPTGMSFFMTALWGFFAYQDWNYPQELGCKSCPYCSSIHIVFPIHGIHEVGILPFLDHQTY